MNQDIGFYFKKIFQIMEKNMNKKLEKIELTNSQANILIYLYNNKETVNQRDIEKKFELTNPTVNGILNRLENKNFIKRTISLKDARNKEIHLTEKSISLINEMKKEAKQLEKEMIAGVSKEELNIFNEVLRKIFNNMQGGLKWNMY